MFFSCGKELPVRKDMALVLANEAQAGPVKGETGIEGLRLDFNAGLRLDVPKGNWHIRVEDGISGQVFFEGELSGDRLQSFEQYYVPWQISVWRDGQLAFLHRLDCSGQKVCLYIDGHASGKLPPLGEAVLMVSCARAFSREQGGHLAVRTGTALAELAGLCFPEMDIVEDIPDDCYATYHLGMYQGEPYSAPCDLRAVPWEVYVCGLMGLRQPPGLERWQLPRQLVPQVRGRYACIAVQASGGRKCWLYPGGWDEVVAYLRGLGYRVLCLDKEEFVQSDGQEIRRPSGAEDFTGNRPLRERFEMLAQAELFIGLPSGLSWLAQAAGCPVVLISGLTLPQTEFFTPYRVSNPFVCHGCYNDLRVRWNDPECPCPRHWGTPRELECSKEITPAQVIEAVERLRRDRGLVRSEERSL